MPKCISLSVTLILSIFQISSLSAQESEAKQAEIYVGIYLNQIYAVSLKDNQFSADFYIWFRWQNENVNPLASFELVNGRIESKDGEYEDTIKGFNYATCRVVATVTKFWDVSRFPLDNHTLTIEIEDSENEEFKLKYIADAENCGRNPEIQVPGWKVANALTEIAPHTYSTNYGDISLPTGSESVYSRFIYSLNIIRPGPGYFLKIFFGVFIAALIAFLSFFIKPTDLDPRFGLGIGAIFAAVASEYVIASSLPDTNILTLADKLHILAFSFIFLSIAESVISLKLFTAEKEKQSKRLDRASFSIFLGSYIILSLLLVTFR